MNLKKTAYLFLALFVAFAALVFTAFATEYTPEYSAEAELTGHCGEDSNVYWEIVPNEDGKTYSMNIFGTGDTFKNLKEDGTNVGYSTYNQTKWSAYLNTLTKVYVGDNIKTLDTASFVRNSAIETVELGANVEALGSAVFEGCTALKTLYRKGNTPVEGTFDLSGITKFEGYTFDGCKNLENIILPNTGAYSLYAEFLKGNDKIETLYIPQSCKKINPLTFRNLTALKAVYFEGETVLVDREITKGGDGTFFAHAFHNCGTSVNDVSTFSISAKRGSPANSWALEHENYSITTKKTTTNSETGEQVTTETTKNYAVNSIDPLSVPIYIDDKKIDSIEIVEGFDFDHELSIGNATYILYEDETCTALRQTKPVKQGEAFYAKTLHNFVGYMVRVADYQGLRAIFEYDTTAFDIEGYTVVEAGILGANYYGIDPILDIDFIKAKKSVIYEGKKCVGMLLELPQNGIVRIANVAVGFEDENGNVVASRVSNRIMNRAFVTVRNDETGDERTYYSIQKSKDLTSACKATIDAGQGVLNNNEMAFIQDLIDLGADPNYIYTREEALEYLTEIYNDPDHILSGQHIGYSKETVKNNLTKLLENTKELPAVLSYDVSVGYRGYVNDPNKDSIVSNLADQFAEYAKQGGLITMCAHMTNPDPEADDESLANGVYRGTLDTIEKWDQLFTSGNVINENFMTELGAIGDFLQLMKDRGVPIFWRPYHETNGAYFWFCGASIPKKQYKLGDMVLYEKDVSAEYFAKLWKFTYDYLVGTRGLDNLIWVYSPNYAKDGSTSSAYDVMKYYPGDDYVEVVGIDWYTNRNVLNNELPELLDTGYTDVWSRLAGKYTGSTTENKKTMTKQLPVVYGEFGPGGDESIGLRNPDPLLSYNGEMALHHVKKVAEAGLNMGWIVFWSGWTDNPISLDMMYKADVFMTDEFIYDLAESRAILLDRHYNK